MYFHDCKYLAEKKNNNNKCNVKIDKIISIIASIWMKLN